MWVGLLVCWVTGFEEGGRLWLIGRNFLFRDGDGRRGAKLWF